VKRLPEILAYLEEKDRDEVVATSLIRLLRSCRTCGKDPRSSRLSRIHRPGPGRRRRGVGRPRHPAILHPSSRRPDDYRLVRVRAAATLAVYRRTARGGDRQSLESARKEAETSFRARPDDHASITIWGTSSSTRRTEEGHRRIRDLLQVASDSVPPLVNASMAYYASGEGERGEVAAPGCEDRPENVPRA